MFDNLQSRMCALVLSDFDFVPQESEWRRKFERLMKDYEKLSGTMGETVLAMEWRER